DRNDRALSLLARSWRKVAKSPLERFLEKSSPGRALIFKKARNNVLKQTGGHYPAPLKAIEVIRASYGEPAEYALKLESEGFGELAASDISKNLVRLFFMRERSLKGKNRGSSAKKMERIGVLGAGTMGAGIAQLAVWNEIPVRLKDVNHEAVAHGMSAAYRVSEEALKRRKVTEREMRQKMRLLTGTTDYSGFKQLDLVVEAVVEDLNIKRRTYRELENVIPNDAIIATNTSSLPMEELAAEMKNPSRFVAMHFFNPVHRMPLLEISSCSRTSPEILETAVHFARRVGKVPLVVKACPGFLVNRLLMPYLNEAGILVEEGAEVEKIDRAMVEFGMPMGPLRLIDEVGIDVAFKVASVLEKAYGERAKAPLITEQIYNNGFLGKKSGIGFYHYEKGKQAGRKVDPRAARVIEEVRESVRGAERRKTGAEHLNSDQLEERMVMAMLNEAVRVLSEKIVVSADDIDLGMIMGTGFPPFLGGPMRYADSLGLESVAETLQRLHRECGERFKPAELLLKLAGEGRTFASLV
ncbi:MAG: hypothetical protein HY391_05575, partial [Deltaproteobacteria bacterium]|nr:hypothetical protein [Deltaproteobacteria bacterium]